MLRCVIVDDEPLARDGLTAYVNQLDFLQLIGSASNPIELTELLSQQIVDLIFLDIQMPIMNGIDFLKMTPNPPMVIITTAYPSYALEGFQLDVIDYLLKPITFNRFFKATTKAKDYFQLLHSSASSTSKANSSLDSFFVKCDQKYEKIYFDDILFIQAMQNYVTIHTKQRKYITLMFLKNVEQNLAGQDFLRVHKSFIVSLSKIDGIEKTKILIQSHQIPISRNFRPQVMQRILGDKLWRNE